MRYFYLENENGERVPLNGESNIWLSDVSGLGFSDNYNYSPVGGGFFINTAAYTEQQNTVTGNLIFKGERDSNYQTFVNWIIAAQKLILVYVPISSEYRAVVTVGFMSKQDGTTPVYRSVPISFNLVTPWYGERNYRTGLTLSNQIGADYVLKLVCSNATKILINCNGETVLTLDVSAFTGTITVDNNAGGVSIKDSNGNDLINSVDLMNTELPQMVHGATLTLTATATSGTVTLSGSVREYFRSV